MNTIFYVLVLVTLIRICILIAQFSLPLNVSDVTSPVTINNRSLKFQIYYMFPHICTLFPPPSLFPRSNYQHNSTSFTQLSSSTTKLQNLRFLLNCAAYRHCLSFSSRYLQWKLVLHMPHKILIHIHF